MFCSSNERVRRRRVATRMHVEAILRHCVAIADLCRRFGERDDDATSEPGSEDLVLYTHDADATAVDARGADEAETPPARACRVARDELCTTVPVCRTAGATRTRDVSRKSGVARAAPPIRQRTGDREDGT